jgi:hypothetical protein
MWRKLFGRKAGNVHALADACFDAEVVILAHSPNASVTYLLEPHLLALGRSAKTILTSSRPPSRIPVSACDTVVIARYLPIEWLAVLRRFRAEGGQVIYFMDDDLMDTAVLKDLPSSYSRKIKASATRRRRQIEDIASEFWVASAYLAEKYAEWRPKILTPRPAPNNASETPPTLLCYHGTASHQAELHWLVPLIESLQSRNETIQFEVFGDHTINRMFRGIPRVSIVHPMSWPNYLAYSQLSTRDIALAPLLPQPFNAGRGPTKFFDFTRLGAVGLYSDAPPYQGFIRDGIDGFLLANDPEVWIGRILALAADPGLRASLLTAARERVNSLAVAKEAVKK